MLQQFLEFIARLFRSQSSHSEEAEQIVKMSMELVASMQQRLTAVETRIAGLEEEIDSYRARWQNDQAEIAALRRRLDDAEQKNRADELTIRELRRRVEELEAKNGGR